MRLRRRISSAGESRMNSPRAVWHETGGTASMAEIVIGCCSWTDHPGFYPARQRPADRLAYYARYFSLVEVDSTFYHPQSWSTTERWAHVTPDDFAFNVKAPRTLTLHERDDAGRVLRPTSETATRLRDSLAPLRAAGKLRAIHLQFPPSFTATDAHRDHLRRLRGWFADDLVSVEFRHRSWLAPDTGETTFALLRELAYVYTVVDEPQGGTNSVPPVVAVTNARLSLFRLHGQNQETWDRPALKGTAEQYTYRYSPAELDALLTKIQVASNDAQTVQVLFNNNVGGYGILNALELRDRLAQPHPPLEAATQTSLL